MIDLMKSATLMTVALTSAAACAGNCRDGTCDLRDDGFGGLTFRDTDISQASYRPNRPMEARTASYGYGRGGNLYRSYPSRSSYTAGYVGSYPARIPHYGGSAGYGGSGTRYAPASCSTGRYGYQNVGSHYRSPVRGVGGLFPVSGNYGYGYSGRYDGRADRYGVSGHGRPGYGGYYGR